MNTSGSSLGRTYAIYPYNRKAAITTKGEISSTLAAEQSYVENSVGRGANMMVAVTSSKKGSHLSFKNMCSYICVELYGKDITLQNIKLQTIVARGLPELWWSIVQVTLCLWLQLQQAPQILLH